MDDRKEGSRLAFQTEDLGPLLAEQLRQQMNNLAAAVQLLTPVVQEKGARSTTPIWPSCTRACTA